MYRIISALLFILASASCFLLPPLVFTEYGRVYSPDGSKYLLTYQYARRSLSSSQSWSVAILRATDSAKEATAKNSFSSFDFDTMYWKGSDTVILVEKFTRFKSEGRSAFADSLFRVNGATAQVTQKDPIDAAYRRKIFYKASSPSNRYELVVYRYVKQAEGDYFLNISVVNKGDSLPKFGNFYISKEGSDCFTDIRWGRADTLDIKVGESCYYTFADNLVRQRPDIKYKVRIEDSAGGNIK